MPNDHMTTGWSLVVDFPGGDPFDLRVAAEVWSITALSIGKTQLPLLEH